MQPWRKRFTQLASMVAEVEQQSTTEPGSSAGSLHAAAPTAAAAAAAGPVLSVLSLEGSKLKLQLSGMSTLTLSAYHIDTELLFTTQPFSSLSAAAGASQSSAISSTARGGDLAGKVHGAGSGLGKVAFVQPTACVALQLPLQCDTPGVSSAVLSTEGTGGTASSVAEMQSLPEASTDGDNAVTASTVASTVVNAPGSAGECCCVLDVDVLMPQLASQSVLLEVAGGGLARTLPR
jgi:hypothetical protein